MKYTILFFVFLLAGCFSDKGNYDYTELNDIVIEGVTDQILYEQLSFHDTLRIHPILSCREEKDLSNLSFQWKLVPMGVNQQPEGEDYIIGDKKNLDYPIIETTGRYMGIYRVSNKNSGHTYSKKFFVNVRMLTSNGLAILCEENNKTRLDWLFHNTETDEILLKDLWGSHPEYAELMGKPISLNYFDYGSAAPESRFRMVNCEKGSFCLDVNQMAGEPTNIKYRFATSQNQIDIRGGNSLIRSSKPRLIPLIDKKGDVYLKQDLSASIFSYPSNKVFGESESFVAAPFVATQAMYGGSQNNACVIFYDQTNCRFVDIRDGWNSVASFSVTKFAGGLFESTANREMIFMETTSALNSYAILRDKGNGKLYIYGFKIGNSMTNTQRYYMELKGPGLEKVTNYLFNNVYDCLFYTTKDKVYRFDLTTGTAATEVLSFPGEEIIKLKTYKRTIFGTSVPTFMLNYQNRFVVATNNTTTNNGNIRVYNIPSLITAPILHREYIDKGIGKIVDIQYFE